MLPPATSAGLSRSRDANAGVRASATALPTSSLLDRQPVRRNPQEAAAHPGAERNPAEDRRELRFHQVLLRPLHQDIQDVSTAGIGDDPDWRSRLEIRLLP